MKYKIIFKNFKSNLKNYLVFFVGNIIGVAEMLIFWGMYYSIVEMLTQSNVGLSIMYDIIIAVGVITIFGTILMIYSMTNYMKLRMRDYGLFTILGLRKRAMYGMMLLEYSVGWFASLLLGMVIGRGIIWTVQSLWHKFYPEFMQVTEVRRIAYERTCQISVGIMAVVLFGVMVWADGKDLSRLANGQEIKEKKPKSRWWSLMVLLGFLLLAIGAWQFGRTGDWPYIYSHVVWIGGGLLILYFGGGILLEEMHRHQKFYMKNLLKLNHLYSRYQSSLLVMLMLFSLHFLALGYCASGIVEKLPLGDYEKAYPYDAVWMARDTEKERKVGEELAKKSGGVVEWIPMLRVSTYCNGEHIGISESMYQELTGDSCDLKDGEAVLLFAEGEKGKKITSESYVFWNTALYIGKMTLEKYEYLSDVAVTMDHEHKFELKDIRVKNLFGEYGVEYVSEGVVVFSDTFFERERAKLLENPEEPTLLGLFTFPEKTKGAAAVELKDYVEKYGVKEETEFLMYPQSTLYISDEFIEGVGQRDLFQITSKLFLILTLFCSGLAAMMIRTMFELPYYSKRYEFLDRMGIREKKRKRTLRAEIQSVPMIAVVAAALLSACYLKMHIVKRDTEGIVLGKEVWLYWGGIVLAYIAVCYLVQRIFAFYVNRKIRKGDRS